MIYLKESINDRSFHFKIDVQNSSIIVESGKSSVLCSVCILPEEIEDKCFSESGGKPLSVFFESRFNAVNKIPGGFKKKDMISDQDIIVSRLIDRCIRPLIPSELNREIRIYIHTLSYNKYCLEVLSVLGASLLLNFLGVLDAPVALCKLSGEHMNYSNPYNSKFKFLAAFSSDRMIMVDYEAMNDLALKNMDIYKTILDKSFKITSSLAKEFNEMQSRIISKVNVQKIPLGSVGFWGRLSAWLLSRKIFGLIKKHDYPHALQLIDDLEYSKKNNYIFNSYIRELVFNKLSGYVLKYKKRMDGRPILDELNPSMVSDIRECDYIKDLVASHKGCHLITRGKTKVIVSLSIGDAQSAQCIESLDDKIREYFWVNYNFLKCNHVKSSKKGYLGASRREIGHSELIKKAIKSLYYDQSKSVRVVCDVLAADGSTSMVSVCAASFIMFQNKLIDFLVAGISIGLIQNGGKKSFFVDLTHLEDEFLSDMDCKVTGTREMITAIQLDIKKNGLSYQEFNELLKIAVVKLNEVLDSMYGLCDDKTERVNPAFSHDFPKSKVGPKKKIADHRAIDLKDKVDLHDKQTSQHSFASNVPEGAKERARVCFNKTGDSAAISRDKGKFVGEWEVQLNSKKDICSLLCGINVLKLESVLDDLGLSFSRIGQDFDVLIKSEGDDQLRIFSRKQENIVKAIKFLRNIVKK